MYESEVGINHQHADVLIVGGGISGLSTAFWLKNMGHSVCILEKEVKAGGYIKSERIQGFLIETGPNSTMNHHEEVDELTRELGLFNEKVDGNALSNTRYLVKSGKLIPVPLGVFPFLTTDLWSLKGKLRLLAEPFVKIDQTNSESVASFFSRRLGQEMVDYGLDPFVSGIYAGNPHQLCMESTFPRIYHLEKEYGSIFKGVLLKSLKDRKKKGKGKKRLFSFLEGMGQLTQRLSEYLSDSLQTGVEIQHIKNQPESSPPGYHIRGVKNGQPISFEGKILVLATPSFVSSRLIASLSSEISGQLQKIPYAPVVLAYLGFERDSVQHPLDGFGCLIPSCEGFELLGSLWNSTLFPQRAPEGCVGLTNFLGGARKPDVIHFPDEKIMEIVINDLNRLLGLKKPPVFSKIIRYPHAIPQYQIGHLRIIEKIDAQLKKFPGLYLTGNFLRGVSVGDCILEGARRAKKINADWLTVPLPENEH